MTSRENIIASVLRVIGWCCLAFGILFGMIYGMIDRPEEQFVQDSFYEMVTLTSIVSGIIWCVIFLGFSEVVSLLQGIYNQGEKKEKHAIKKKPILTPKQELALQAEAEIKSYYASVNKVIDLIESTEIEDVYRVEREGNLEYIELGGFKPKVLTEEDFNKLLD